MGVTPIAGWFISWKIPSRNGWWLGVPCTSLRILSAPVPGTRSCWVASSGCCWHRTPQRERLGRVSEVSVRPASRGKILTQNDELMRWRFPKSWGTPKWLVYKGESHKNIKNGWFGGTPMTSETSIRRFPKSWGHLLASSKSWMTMKVYWNPWWLGEPPFLETP